MMKTYYSSSRLHYVLNYKMRKNTKLENFKAFKNVPLF